MALVDIVIPNYRHGRYLRQCVDSVTSQGIPDIRFLIIDNASDDDSVEVATELAANDPRISFTAREENLGHHASYNEGVDWAASKYFLLLCADDLLAPGCFLRSLPLLDSHPEVAFACGSEVVWEETDPFPQFPTMSDASWRFLSDREFILERSLPSATLLGGGAALLRTAVLKQAGHYRQDVYFNEDLELMFRLAQNRKVALTTAIHGIRRLHGANLSATFWDRNERELTETLTAFDSFFSREGSTMPDMRALRRQVYRNFGSRAYWSGISHVVRGHIRTGLSLLRMAVRYSPRAALIPPVDYLFRIDNPWHLIRARLTEAMKSQRSTHPALEGGKNGKPSSH